MSSTIDDLATSTSKSEVLTVGHAFNTPSYLLVTVLKMKLSTAVVVLSLSGASAYSVTRSSLRSLGQKTVSVKSPSRSVEPQMKMEGKGFFLSRSLCYIESHFMLSLVY